jgi:glutaredoxin
MTTLRWSRPTNTCDRCKRVNPIDFQVEPEEAWRTVVLNRWKKLCPSCFDQLAEQAGVRYRFVDLEGMSWSEIPAPRSRSKRGR